MAQTLKNMPAMQESQIRSLDQEDALEQKIATHSGILAWKIPWTEEPGVANSQPWLNESHWWTNSSIMNCIMKIDVVLQIVTWPFRFKNFWRPSQNKKKNKLPFLNFLSSADLFTTLTSFCTLCVLWFLFCSYMEV